MLHEGKIQRLRRSFNCTCKYQIQAAEHEIEDKFFRPVQDAWVQDGPNSGSKSFRASLSRKLRESKKRNEGGEERRKRLPANPTILKNAPSVSFSPLPLHSFVLLSQNFLDELARKRLLRKLMAYRTVIRYAKRLK